MHMLKNVVKKGHENESPKCNRQSKKTSYNFISVEEPLLSGNKSFNYLVLIYCSSLVCNLIDLYKL